MKGRIFRELSSGPPAQFLEISEKRRCSMGFHLGSARWVVGDGERQAV